MAVFGAVISYFMQCVSFILLRRRLPNIDRPYRSPVGEWGAAIAALIALCSLGAILYNADYRPGVYGVAVVYLVALAYFAAAGRHRLVLSPEEEFAHHPRRTWSPRGRGLRSHQARAVRARHDRTTRRHRSPACTLDRVRRASAALGEGRRHPRHWTLTTSRSPS